MSEDLLIQYASPTLAGIKTGNLFSCPCESRTALLSEIRAVNRALVGKGLCLIPMKITGTRALLYLYRPSRLAGDLSDAGAVKILKESGYESGSAGAALRQLIARLKGGDGFPHEIGLFLSYPPEDVRGFMENRACNFKCSGCWKVYGDADAARKCFDRYKKCTREYCRRYRMGVSVEHLAVVC